MKKRKHIFISALFLFLIVETISAQTVEWVKTFGGTNSDGATSVGTDAFGNVFVIGDFNGTVDFDPGVGVQNRTSVGFTDLFVQKLDPSGNLLWVKTFGGTGFDEAKSVSIDASGNVYTVGYFSDTVDFDPGSGVLNLVSNGYRDVFIQKLDASGNLVWAKAFGGTNFDEAISLSMDASGNLYTVGNFRDTVDFDPGAGVQNHISNGFYDVFIQKLDPSGNLVWVKTFGGANFDYPTGISTDASGNVYTVGTFRNTVDFDPSTDVYDLTPSGDNDIFIQKLSASGDFLWAKSYGNTTYNDAKSLTVDVSGNVYIVGSFEDTLDFDPGPGTQNLISNGVGDVFVQKLNASGDFVWAKSFGGISLDLALSVKTDVAGNIYTVGFFKSTVDFDPNSGTIEYSSFGNQDIFIHKLGPSGEFHWAKALGGVGADVAVSVIIGESNNAYVAGFFQLGVDFDDISEQHHKSNGETDVFVQKINDNSIGIEENTFSFSIHPNPTTGKITIETNEPIELIEVYSTTGKKVASFTEKSFSLEAMQTGVYFVKVLSDKGTAVQRIVKE